MFRNTVAANRDAPLVHDAVPKILGALHVSLVPRKFRDTRKAHYLRHLRVRVNIREVVVICRHRIQKPLVAPALGLVQVLRILGKRIGIGIDLRHTAMFRTEHGFHLGIVEPARNGKPPVAKRQEHRFRLFIARIDVSIAQARIKLVDIVPGHPIAILRTGIAAFHAEPHLFAIGHAADVALEIIVLGILVLNRLEFAQHIFQAFLDKFIPACRIMHRQGAQVMAQHMAIEARPVRELGSLRTHSRFFVERGKQAVRIVAEQGFHVQVLTVLQGPAKQLHVAKREHVRVKHVLRQALRKSTPQNSEDDASEAFHLKSKHLIPSFPLTKAPI